MGHIAMATDATFPSQTVLEEHEGGSMPSAETLSGLLRVMSSHGLSRSECAEALVKRRQTVSVQCDGHCRAHCMSHPSPATEFFS